MEIQRYDAEIPRLRSVFAELEEERAALEEYSRLCQCTLSPIRRLPFEIMTEIFAFFVPEVEPWDSLEIPDDMSHSDAVTQEMQRVTNTDLTRFSRVCLRWRCLIMGTPSLWSTLNLNLDVWGDSPHLSRMLDTLKYLLQRSADLPLTLGIQHASNSKFSNRRGANQVLELLAAYSMRWHTASFSVSPSRLEHISTVANNLPLLEDLCINVPASIHYRGWSRVASFFTVVPRLKTLVFCGPPAVLRDLPLEQTQMLVAVEVLPHEMDDTLPVLARIPDQCCLRFDLDDEEAVAWPGEMPPMSSNLSALIFDGGDNINTNVAKSVMSRFMSRLTLPRLKLLSFHSAKYKGHPLPWQHTDFLSLSHCSSFSTTLEILELDCVFIMEHELLEVLGLLHSLLRLSISDYGEISGAERLQFRDIVLVTDELLNHLSWTTDESCLVPYLCSLTLHTIHAFSAAVLREFVLSRVKGGKFSEVAGFKLELLWDPARSKQLDPDVAAKFYELDAHDELVFVEGRSELLGAYQNSDESLSE